MSVPLVDQTFLRKLGFAALVAFSVAGAAIGLAVFREVALLVVLGLVFSELFQAIADPLHARLGGPRGLWIFLTVILFFAAVAGLAALCLYPLLEQLSKLLAEMPRLAQSLARRGDAFTQWLDGGRAATAPQPHQPIALDKLVSARLGALALGGGAVAVAALSGVFKALAVMFMGVFVAATPAAHLRIFLGLLPEPLRPRGNQFVAGARRGIRNWMVAVSVSMVIMGALVTTGLWLIGVPYFLVWGLFAGVMELVPYLGPVMAFAGPTAICLATDPTKAVYVGLFYLVVHGLEANVIVPLVVKNRAHVPPSLVVLAILFFGSLAGLVGLIAATPALTIVLAAVKAFWLEPHTTDETVHAPLLLHPLDPGAKAAA